MGLHDNELIARITANKAMREECRVACDPTDLGRFRSGQKLVGEIKAGDILVWEPDNRQVCEIVQVMQVRSRYHGESSSLMIDMRGGQLIIKELPPDDETGYELRGARWSLHKTAWNDEGRMREACVRALIKFVPDWSNRDGGIEWNYLGPIKGRWADDGGATNERGEL